MSKILYNQRRFWTERFSNKPSRKACAAEVWAAKRERGMSPKWGRTHDAGLLSTDRKRFGLSRRKQFAITLMLVRRTTLRQKEASDDSTGALLGRLARLELVEV